MVTISYEVQIGLMTQWTMTEIGILFADLSEPYEFM